MKTLLTALILLAPSLSAIADDTDQPTQRLDLSNVTAIRITGEASSISLTTTESEPYQATLGGTRSGWFAKWYSSWFYTDCRTSSRMHIENTTLYVEASPTSWLEPSDCKVEFKASVRKETSVTIEQAASKVDLTGDYSAISLDNKAADFTLNGYARSVDLRGDALRSHLRFERASKGEAIRIAGNSLDASLTFTSGTQIRYRVDALAAMVDSALPNTPQADTSVEIKGQYVRATIR